MTGIRTAVSFGCCADVAGPCPGKGLQELTTDEQLEAVIKTLAEAGNSPLRLYLSGALLPPILMTKLFHTNYRLRRALFASSDYPPEGLLVFCLRGLTASACAVVAAEVGETGSGPTLKPATSAPRLSQSTSNGGASPRTPADVRPTPRSTGPSPLIPTSSASAPCELYRANFLISCPCFCSVT